MKQITYFLALGSNQGDKKKNILQAISLLKLEGDITSTSSLYRTDPVDMPPGSQCFYNLTICLKSSRQPLDLLAKIKDIEKQLGRNLTHSHKQPRPIDIDILLADELIITTNSLTIPHPAMTQRAFVLVPLQEIAGDVIHPGENKFIDELLLRLKPIRGVEKLKL